MLSTNRYRSVFSGREIDEAIASMKNTLSSDLIVNDFTTGGQGKIASAELTKILKSQVDANDDPAHIKSQLLSVPNTHTLNDLEYSTIQELTASSSFRGSFVDAAARDVAIANSAVTTADMKGNEITFLEDDGSGDGLSEFSRWDTSSNSWEKIQLYNLGEVKPQTIAVASSVVLFSYRTEKYNTMKCLVSVCNSTQTQRQVCEVLVTHVGVDTYVSIYSEIGNVSTLFDVSTTIASGLVNLIITTKSPNLTISGKRIAML